MKIEAVERVLVGKRAEMEKIQTEYDKKHAEEERIVLDLGPFYLNLHAEASSRFAIQWNTPGENRKPRKMKQYDLVLCERSK